MEIPKFATGVEGLDQVLRGGLPRGRTSVLSGGPGSGKTLLGLQALVTRAETGGSGVLVACEETPAAIRENALALGWDLARLEESGRLAILDAYPRQAPLTSGDFDLQGLLAVAGGKAGELGAELLVFDGLDVLLRLLGPARRQKDEVYALHRWLGERGASAILTAKLAGTERGGSLFAYLDYLADCLLYLDQRVVAEIITRRLRVVKCRGTGAGRNEYPFVIAPGGLQLMAITSTELGEGATMTPISSGHPELDTMLGGGYRKGSSDLISGETGTGKTTFACLFADAACRRGENVFYLGFEEAASAIQAEMRSPGLDLAPHIEADRLRFHTVIPEARGVEEHLIAVLDEVGRFRPDHVIVDAVSAFMRVGGAEVGFKFAARLVSELKRRGCTCLLLNQIEGMENLHEISGIGVSTLLDTVVFLRYREVGGELNRMALVLKSRGMPHSNQYREYRITHRGIRFQELYVGTGGALTGTARREQELREEADRRRHQLTVARKEREIEQLSRQLAYQVELQRSELALRETELDALRLERDLWHREREQRRTLRGEGAADAASADDSHAARNEGRRHGDG